ncbi:MAG: hypothetical protein HPAVJP_3910 [Candidatus Hepatoplasma vulgare]|nr:MAG: hypothetical protein HPAVJP_3910 [Candidatus Hepatoplasma sp.]
MKKILWIFPIIPIILVSQFYNFGFKNSINLEEDALYPYFVDSSNMINVIAESSTLDSFIFEMDVIDNTNNDFYNSATSSDNDFNVSVRNTEEVNDIPVTFLLNQSNPEENEYRFLVDLSDLSDLDEFENGYIDTINNFGISVDGNSEPAKRLVAIGNKDYELKSSSTTDFNVIDSNNNIKNKKLIIDDSYEGHSDNVKFYLPIENIGENANTPSTIEISLQDMSDTDEKTNTKTYNANLIDDNNLNGKYYQIEGLDASKPYKFLSINNSNLTIDNIFSYNPNNNIFFEEDLSYSESDLTFNTNPYILDDGSAFTINNDSSTINSIEFSINVIDNSANDFYNNLSANENKIEITLNNSNGEKTNINEATYIGKNEPEDGVYIFKIEGLESNTSYELVSLNNTNLSIGNGINPTSSIITLEEIGITNTTFTTTMQTPFIEEESFSITNVTYDSLIFEMKINSTVDISYEPKDMKIKIEDLNEIYHDTTAYYSPENSDIENSIYAFEVNELDSTTHEEFKRGTEYKIYSLENTGLAIGNSGAEIDNSIIIEDDLNENGSFTTTGNPYIDSNDGFKITKTSKDSIQFQLKIIDGYNNNYVPLEQIDVTIKDSNEKEYQTIAKYLYSDEESNYIFEVTELDSTTHNGFETEKSYEIYSLNNINLAVGDDSAEIQNTILTSDLVTNENQMFFEISENNWIWILVLLILIILVIIGIFIIWKIIRRKDNDTIIGKIEKLIETKEESIEKLIENAPISKIENNYKKINNKKLNTSKKDIKNNINEEKINTNISELIKGISVKKIENNKKIKEINKDEENEKNIEDEEINDPIE